MAGHVSTASPGESLRDRFARLAARWKDETGHLSSITPMVLHPAYQRIIEMGSAALPLILEDLSRTQDHWFWALQAITGEDPVSPGDRGRVPAMAAAWLAWGRARGLI